jgi:hypothetical protein
VSVHDSEAAVDRLAERVRSMTVGGRAGYLLIAMSILAWNSPDVANFILDRADDAMAANDPVDAARGGDDD